MGWFFGTESVNTGAGRVRDGEGINQVFCAVKKRMIGQIVQRFVGHNDQVTPIKSLVQRRDQFLIEVFQVALSCFQERFRKCPDVDRIQPDLGCRHVEDPRERMSLKDIEPPPRREEARDHPRPGFQVRVPTQWVMPAAGIRVPTQWVMPVKARLTGPNWLLATGYWLLSHPWPSLWIAHRRCGPTFR